MDWLGTNLPFKKVEYLLEKPFNIELDRLYHMTRLSYLPEVLYKSIHSNYFEQFIKLFDIDSMTIDQVVYGINWVRVLCKETTITSKLSILPFEKMITHSHPEVRKVTLKLLAQVLSLTVNEKDALNLSSRLHTLLLTNLIIQSRSKNSTLSELLELVECLKNLEFGSEQKNESVVVSSIEMENLGTLINPAAPATLKTGMIAYLVKLNYFKSNRDTFYSSSLLDVILTMNESQAQLPLLKNVLSMDVRMKRLLVN